MGDIRQPSFCQAYVVRCIKGELSRRPNRVLYKCFILRRVYFMLILSVVQQIIVKYAVLSTL
jgi:hypothetical protein